MAKSSPIQTNFTGGELSPRLEGRVDLDKYGSGCKTLQNVIVQPHGPASMRGGTQYVSAGKISTKKARLVPFQFSTTQAYMLEFGDLYIRVFLTQAALLAGAFVPAFALAFNKNAPLEITTPYTEAQLFELQFTQSADVLYISHSAHQPRTLSRAGAITWTLALLETLNGPYLNINPDATLTLTPSATTGSITVTASAAVFLAGHIGSIWRYGTGNGYFKITGFTSTLIVTATVVKTLSGTTAISDWSEGSWSDVNGYPAAVAFFEQRLVFGGSLNDPQTIWGSINDDYTNFLAGVADGDAITYTIASKQVNSIQWLSSGDVLAVGTAGGIHVASGSTRDSALTPTNVRFVRKSSFGCKQIEPITVADVALFVQRGGAKVRQLQYAFESDSYSTPDITILSEHITRSGIVQMAYQQDPDSIIWAVRSDGQLIGMTFEKDQNVFAWHRHIAAGSSDAVGANAIIESVAAIPSLTDPVYDEVWLSVRRWIDGAVVRHLEIISPGHKPDGAIEDAFFVDSGLTYSGGAATVISGLDHLEGETVSILADGATHPTKTVVVGTITLDRPATKAHIGLGYTGDIELLNLEVGSDTGTSQGKNKRISKVTLKLYQTVGLQVGPDVASLDRIPFRDSSDLMDTALPLFTGEKVVEFDDDGDSQAIILIRQDQPLPMTVLAVMPEVQTNG